MQVSSYGVGGHVKLPGKTQKEPNVYEFGTPYQYIYDELKAKDLKLYTRNGLLQMLERNLAVKTAPERWQENRYTYLMASTHGFVTHAERTAVPLFSGVAAVLQNHLYPI